MSEKVVDLFSKINELSKSNVEVVPEFEDFYSFLKVMEYLRNMSTSGIVSVELFDEELTIKARNYLEYDSSNSVVEAGKCLESIVTFDFVEVNDIVTENVMDNLYKLTSKLEPNL